jgi:hypothetical protein
MPSLSTIRQFMEEADLVLTPDPLDPGTGILSLMIGEDALRFYIYPWSSR